MLNSISSTSSSALLWRGRNAAAKALQPPIVERRNVFSLYWDLEPLPELDTAPNSLVLSTVDEQRLYRNTVLSDSPASGLKEVQSEQHPLKAPLARFETSPLKGSYTSGGYETTGTDTTTTTTTTEEDAGSTIASSSSLSISALVRQQQQSRMTAVSKQHQPTLHRTPSQSSIADERPMILFVAELKELNVRLSLANNSPEQVVNIAVIQLFVFFD